MPLVIDGSRVEQFQGTLVLRLRDVIDELSHNGRYVEDITINGREVTVGAVLRPDFQCDDEDDIRVVTCSLDELVSNTMESSYEVTPRLYNSVKQCVEQFRVGRQENGIEILSRLIDSVQWHAEVIGNLAQLHPGPSTIHQHNDDLTAVIQQVYDAWDGQDYVLLTDVLEYEVLTWIERWYATVELFRNQMRIETLKQNGLQ